MPQVKKHQATRHVPASKPKVPETMPQTKADDRPIVLSPDTVTEYVVVNREYTSLEKRRKVLRDGLLYDLQVRKLPCPDDGPFVLEVEVARVCSHTAQEMLQAVISQLGDRAKRKALKLVAQMQDMKEDQHKLAVKVNPAYPFLES